MAERYKDIEGWFHFGGAYERALQLPVVENPVWVEIGAYKGKSSCYMMERLLEEERNDVHFYVVDHFQGSPEHDITKSQLMDAFFSNVGDLLEKTNTDVLIEDSVDASERFEDGSVQFVMVDGNHYFEAVIADIKAWWPKLSPGGIMAFDDWNLDLDPMYWRSVSFGIMSALRQLGVKDQVLVGGAEKWPYAFVVKES